MRWSNAQVRIDLYKNRCKKYLHFNNFTVVIIYIGDIERALNFILSNKFDNI